MLAALVERKDPKFSTGVPAWLRHSKLIRPDAFTSATLTHERIPMAERAKKATRVGPMTTEKKGRWTYGSQLSNAGGSLNHLQENRRVPALSQADHGLDQPLTSTGPSSPSKQRAVQGMSTQTQRMGFGTTLSEPRFATTACYNSSRTFGHSWMRTVSVMVRGRAELAAAAAAAAAAASSSRACPFTPPPNNTHTHTPAH